MKKSSFTSVQGHQSSLKTHVKVELMTPDKSRSGTGKEWTPTPEKRRPLSSIQKNKGIKKNVPDEFIAKSNLTEKSVQTDNSADIVTSKEPTLEYWKLLAEERRIAIEEVLQENQTLTEKVEALEKENNYLSELLEDAKTLAEMINNISEDADESGFVNDGEENELSGQGSETT